MISSCTEKKCDVPKPLSMLNDYPFNIGKCFRWIVLDKVHFVRNLDSNQSLAMSWLDSDFHLLLSATPLYNSINDFKGYVRFLVTCPFIWTAEHLAAYGLHEHSNLYDLEFEQSGSHLQVTAEAMNKFIFHDQMYATVARAQIGKV